MQAAAVFGVVAGCAGDWLAGAAVVGDLDESLVGGDRHDDRDGAAREEYAWTLLVTYPGATEEKAAERLAARLSRQEIVSRDSPPRVWVLVYESVLYNLVDSAETMYSQIMRMVEASRLPNVTVQVLPAGLHVASKGDFHIAEVSGTCSAAYIDDPTDGRTTQDPVTLTQLSERFRYLQTEAMTPSASREFMEKVAKDQWSEA